MILLYGRKVTQCCFHRTLAKLWSLSQHWLISPRIQKFNSQMLWCTNTRRWHAAWWAASLLHASVSVAKPRAFIHHSSPQCICCEFICFLRVFFRLDFAQTVEGMRGSNFNTTEISDDSKSTTVSTTKQSNMLNITPFFMLKYLTINVFLHHLFKKCNTVSR